MIQDAVYRVQDFRGKLVAEIGSSLIVEIDRFSEFDLSWGSGL